MKVKSIDNCSSVYHSQKMEQQKLLLLTILIVGDTSLKNVWVNKSKLILLENNLKDMYLKLLVDLTVMDLL